MGSQRVGHDWATELNWTSFWPFSLGNNTGIIVLKSFCENFMHLLKLQGFIPSPYISQEWVCLSHSGRQTSAQINYFLIPKRLPSIKGRWGMPFPIHSWAGFNMFACTRWRRQWQPTPVLLPGDSHGWRSLVGCSPWGREESNTTERLHFHFSLSYTGEGNGTPLQCSLLENPRDRGAWWAAVSRVAQSWTWLKRPSSSKKTILRNIWKEFNQIYYS